MNFQDNYENTDIWQYLSQTKKTIVMYGMGNGADKIISHLNEKHIEVYDFFASDGFVRGHSFHDKRVLSFTEITEKYTDFIILLSFGSSRREVLDFIYSLDEKYELYAPEVPVYGDGIFDRLFLNEHLNDTETARESLSDDESKRIFDCLINYYISGKIKYLRSSFCSRNDIVNDVLKINKYKCAVDLGAYIGDTAEEISSYPNIKKIIAVEPDRKSFEKLCRNVQRISDIEISTLNVSVSNYVGESLFSNDGNKNSSLFGNKSMQTIEVTTVDSICKNENIDYIKMDVEGSESKAILGADNIIRKNHPDLAVSVYHRVGDIFKLINLIHSNYPWYNLYLRRPECIPAWDTVLYAIDDI
jgi:FkbM family methyltransferase